MEAIEIYVSSASAKVVHAPEITKGTVGLPVRFTFDEAWKGLGKTAVFSAGGVTKDRVGIVSETTVPPEVLAQVGAILEIGVYGTDTTGECVIPSRMATVDHIHDGADPTGDESINPELPLWQQALAQFEQTNQILDDVKEAAQEARSVAAELEQARENGEFTGQQGPQGPQGLQGEPGVVNIDDAGVSRDSAWSSEKVDEELNLRGGGRFGKYDAKTPGWKRILNIIRATSGTLNVGLVQPSLGYSMVQYAMLDIGGCVQFHNDKNAPTALPVIRQRLNHTYGEDNAIADPAKQAKITKVRIAYPKKDATYPIPDSKGVYKSPANPINCYVDVYLDFDPEWKNNGYDVTRSFIYNFSGVTDSHNCTAITEEVDATDIGMYGEELEFYEYELKEDAELDAEFNEVTASQVTAKSAKAEKLTTGEFEALTANATEQRVEVLYVVDGAGKVKGIITPEQVALQPTIDFNVGTRGMRTYSSSTPNMDSSGTAISNNFALGWGCAANASATFAACVKAIANMWGSAALGGYTKAEYAYMLAAGKYNSKPGSSALFAVGNGTAEGSRSNALEVLANGNVVHQSEISSSNGADYAEFFEWLDGNLENEDRVGLAVCLEGDKIRLAQSGDDVLGIISGTAAVLGDSAEMHWKGKYLTDEYGRMLHDMVEEFEEVEDPETKEVKTVSVGFFPHPRLNPDYDPETAYVPREERPEWDKVGLMGKLYTRDDGTCIAGGYGCVGTDGVLTRSDTPTNIRVMKRTGDNIVLVLMK